MESFVSPTSTLTITPLMRSIYVNGARVIDKLLELGVDINSQVEANGNLTGKCEHMISIFSSPKFTKGHFFLQKRTFRRILIDFLAVMLSVQCNNLTVVRRLLESDSPPANLACQDNNCRTVLHHATLASKWGYWENTEMVKLLIEAGALLNDEGRVLFCYRIFLISFP